MMCDVSTISCTACSGPIGDTVYLALTREGDKPLCASCASLTEHEAAVQWNKWTAHLDRQKPLPERRPVTDPHATPCVSCGRGVEVIEDHRRVRQPRHLAFCCDDCRRERANVLRRRSEPEPRRCASCGEAFTPRRSDAVTCSPSCRQRLHRRTGQG